MALNNNKDLKMYYSIKEVAKELNTTETTLRYWESVFPQVSPYKGANGVRRYTREDIKKLRTIYHLVKERGLTLSGAKKQLKNALTKENADTNSEVIDRLKAIKEELLGIKHELDTL
ncbi:MAG: MerR family transcriptional regulator [Bacteroidaceae bacterium]|jgi:DNA-binding transcriptional MerR regulator|nr:MerR family transcriptional regulator [Bacteroidaceae bacterium]